MKTLLVSIAGILVSVVVILMAQAQSHLDPIDLQVYAESDGPKDHRIGSLVNLNGHFPFEVPKTKQEWEVRSAKLRRQVQVATGLYPFPEKTPLNPVLHGQFRRDGVTIDKVYFESVPGHFVTGLLFRPENPTDNMPGVLCPHGHGGRKATATTSRLHKMIAAGQERFLESGQNPKVSRSIHLARMGCAVFLFDMLGYGDSVQLSYDLAHRFTMPRTDLENDQQWGLYTTQAEMRLQTIMGIQTWNAIRGLDFLESLPGVDPKRLAVTGGSGGGTQTILVCALDPRPVVAFPQGMVSTSMQGGCVCENCNLLRLGTGNVELAALFAPKPQAMTAADDWTVDMMTDGYPQLQQLYAMVGSKDDVFCKGFPNFPHNYNYVSRALMYQWFNQHLKLGLQDPVLEEDYPQLTAKEQAVWNEDHPAPTTGLEYEKSLVKYLAQRDDAEIHGGTMDSQQEFNDYQQLIRQAFQSIVVRSELPTQVETESMGQIPLDKIQVVKQKVRNLRHDEELPVIRVSIPEKANGKTVVWLSGQGKAGLLDDEGQLQPAVVRLLESGVTIVGADLFQQGEFLKVIDGENVVAEENRTVDFKAQYAGYTFGYNQTLLANRVHDVMTLVGSLKQQGKAKIDLLADSEMSPVALVARAIVGEEIDRAAILNDGFRFKDLKDYRDQSFLPGAVKYGDVEALTAIAAPAKTWVGGEAEKSLVKAAKAYRLNGKADALKIEADSRLEEAVSWLINE